MARPRTPPRHTARFLVASAQRLRPDDDKILKAYRKRGEEWQQRAFAYNDEVPELGFAHDYVRDALSRVRIFAGIRPAPDQPPAPIDDGPLANACAQLLNRLEPHADLMGDMSQNLDIAGDCTVVVRPDPDEPDGERCQVLSVFELRTRDNQLHIFTSENDSKGEPLDLATMPSFRVFTRHPKFAGQATSPMRRLNSVAEELLLLTRMIKSAALSRLAVAHGILLIPDELSFASATGDGESSTDDAGDGEGTTDPFFEDLMIAAETAISDPDSAAAAIPIIVRGPAEFLKEARLLELNRPFDATAANQRTELLGRIGNGENLPREVVLGVGGTNHWNADQIDDQTWRVHLEPRARRGVAAITSGYLRAELVGVGIDPDVARTVEVWFDPAALFAQPNPSEHAEEAFSHYAISGDAYLRARGFDESDKPGLDEVKYRLWIKQQERITIRESADAPPGEVEPAPTDVPAATNTPTPAIVAGAGRAPQTLGKRLVAIERDVRTRLLADANATLLRALERAGNRVANKVRNAAATRAPEAQRALAAHRALAEQIVAVPVYAIPSVVGRATVASLGLAEVEMLDGAFADMETRYHALVTRAQLAAVAATARVSSRTRDDAQAAEFAQRSDDNRKAGWLLLAGALTQLAHDTLYAPHPVIPAAGEFDATFTVPVGIVRAALDRAGGAPVAATARGPRALESRTPGPGGPPGGGGATAGPDMLAEFKETLGIVEDSYVWAYGDAPRSREFEPHVALDGIEFAAFDDETLANPDSFPESPFYFPGDHDGCGCDVVVTFAQAPTGEEP